MAGDTGIHVSALQTWYQDADGDGFGNPSVSMQSCTQPVGYVLNNLDCNDANAGINPYAVEVCGNGIDDNCDGYTDQAINKALNFDGVDDVVIVQSSQMPQTSTWEAWINTTSASEMFIIQFERPDYAYIFLQNGQLGYGKTQNGLNYAWVGGPNLADGNWHHVAMVRSPGLINLYADGNYLYNLELTDTILAYMLTIGDMAEGGEAFNGSIDEVRIWNTALTQQQIQASMNIKLDGNETNLYRYYDFDEGIPGANNNGIVSLRDRMIDSSNNGTLMNFALTGSTSNWINSWTYPAMYADHDGDGFGSGTAWTCGSMHGLVNNNLDCNDNDASINPYAIEICGNGIDDNCDGNIDFEVNKALNFDGVNDHVSVPVWSFNPPFTLEVWINTTSGSSTMNLMAWEGVDYAQLFIQNGYPGYSENFSGWAGGWNIADGNWHHLAVVRTASAVTMFIDGSEAWSNSISNTPSTSTLTLGDWSNGGLPYSGSMDEVRIWSTALSQRQIQATMNRKLDGNEANLVRYYTFDEGKPGQDNVGISSLRDRIVDSSNNATLENFALTGSNSNWVSSWAYPTLYADNDGDGFGAGNAWTCGSMTGWVANDLDCTDNNAAVNPRAQELVDGVDNNCNGAIDENSALNFNGTNNYAQLSWFERPDSMTAEFWIKTTENSSNQEDILSWIGYANGQSFTELALVNGGLYYDETNNGAGYAMGYYAINDGNWHHVALIRNPSLIYIYVDGVLRLANSFNMPSSTNVFNLGFFDWSADSTSPAPDRYLNGTVDELRVYSEVRSQSQIQADMICGDIGPATNLLCYYDFNQGVPNGNNADYTNIYDYSGHLGTGSLHNFSLTGTSSNFVAGEPAPILVVAGKGLTILNKENSPLLTNNTDFGPVNLNTPAVNTFTLKNTGSANLTVNSITSAGTNQTEFVTSGITLPAAIASGDSITFTVTFTPTANGIRSTVIHVSNTTCQQGDYYFDVQGTGGAAINQWTGAGGNSLWSTAANWSANSVPNDCSANVLIASATGNNWPTITTPVNVGSFTMTAGSITLSDTLSICGNVTGTSSGNLPQVTGGGVLALTGSSQQTISGKLQAVNVKINNTTGVVMQPGSSVYVSNILELQSGNLNTTAGTLTLTSTSANQIGIIDNFSQGYAGTITGNIVAQRYFDASLYAHQHLIGSPVYNPTMSQLSPTGAAGYIEDHDCDETQSDNGTPYGNIFSYNESHGSVCEIQSWYVETNGTRTLNPGEGYSYLNIGAGTISLTGVPNLNSSYGVSASVNGGVSSPLTNGGWSAQYTLQHRPMLSGFNLIANPYPAPVVIGLQSDQSTNNSTFGSKVYVFETEGTRQGSYMATDTIAPFQAFMVQRTSPGSGGTYTIFGSDRVRSSASFYRQYTDNQLNITSTNSATGLIDETTIAFNSASTNNYDPVYDAYKIPGALNRHTMYTLNNNNWMSINTLTSIEETGTVAMGFEPGVSGTYTLSFDGINTFDPTCYIMLEDLQTGTMYNIRNGAYTFTSNIADDWNRFVLHFTPPAEILSTDATCEAPGEINIVQAGNATWNYLVKDENNKVTANGILNNTNLISISANVGIYTLTLTDTSGYTVMKNIQVGGVQRVIAAFATSTTTAQVQENITFNSDSANVTSYSWDFGDGSTAVGITSSHIYQVQGVYNVVLMVKGEGGCVSSTAKNITVTSRSITGIQDVTKGKLNIWSHGNVVYIDFSDQGNVEAEIEMYDVLGQLLSSDKFGSSTVYTKQIGNTEAAYIIVKVKNDECVTTKKVFISNLDK